MRILTDSVAPWLTPEFAEEWHNYQFVRSPVSWDVHPLELWSNPAYAAVVGLSLALGLIGSCLAFAGLVHLFRRAAGHQRAILVQQAERVNILKHANPYSLDPNMTQLTSGIRVDDRDGKVVVRREYHSALLLGLPVISYQVGPMSSCMDATAVCTL